MITPEPKFYLKNKDAKNSLIYLRANYSPGYKSYKVFTYSINEKVNPDFFDNGHATKHSRAAIINRTIDKYKMAFIEIFDQLKYDEISINNEILKKKMDEYFHPDRLIQITLTNYFGMFIKKAEAGEIVTEKGKRFSKNVIKTYKTIEYRLEEFNKVHPDRDKLHLMNDEFYNLFIKWHNDNDYSLNSIGTSINKVKQLLRLASKEYKVDQSFLNWRGLREESHSIYLNDEELQKFYKAKLKGRLAIDRDIFILRAYTGPRISDTSQIDRSAFFTSEGKLYLTIKSQKTDTKSVVPVNSIVKAIITKYNYNLPLISDQKHNLNIKQAAKESKKFKKKVRVTKTKGGKRVEETYFKHQLITSHTARRSFATNLFLNKVDINLIRELLGHSKVDQTLSYIKASQEDNARLLADHPYFN